MPPGPPGGLVGSVMRIVVGLKWVRDSGPYESIHPRHRLLGLGPLGQEPADPVVGEADAGPSGPGRRGCGRRRSTGWRSSRRITSKSGLRNSFHSVTIARASASSSAAVGAVAVGEPVAVDLADVGDRLGVVDADGDARRRAGASISTSAGASRMSSVLGLNARPQTATVLPCGVAAEVVEDLACRGRPSARSLTSSTASIIRDGQARATSPCGSRRGCPSGSSSRRSRRPGRGS